MIAFYTLLLFCLYMLIYQFTHAHEYGKIEYWKAAFRRSEASEELGYFLEAAASFKRYYFPLVSYLYVLW